MLTFSGVDVFSNFSQNTIAEFAIITAALCYAATTLYIRRYVSIAPLQMVTGTTLVEAMVITTCALIFENPFHHRSPPAISVGAMAYFGVMATATANLLYFYLVPRLGAGCMSQIKFTGACIWGDHRNRVLVRTLSPPDPDCPDPSHPQKDPIRHPVPARLQPLLLLLALYNW